MLMVPPVSAPCWAPTAGISEAWAWIVPLGKAVPLGAIMSVPVLGTGLLMVEGERMSQLRHFTNNQK